MKKEISSLKLWKNGAFVNATQILVYSVYDDFQSFATFAFVLFDAKGNELDKGNVDMKGQEYLNWGKNGGDLNLEAVQFVCAQMNFKLK